MSLRHSGFTRKLHPHYRLKVSGNPNTPRSIKIIKKIRVKSIFPGRPYSPPLRAKVRPLKDTARAQFALMRGDRFEAYSLSTGPNHKKFMTLSVAEASDGTKDFFLSCKISLTTRCRGRPCSGLFERSKGEPIEESKHDPHHECIHYVFFSVPKPMGRSHDHRNQKTQTCDGKPQKH